MFDDPAYTADVVYDTTFVVHAPAGAGSSRFEARPVDGDGSYGDGVVPRVPIDHAALIPMDDQVFLHDDPPPVLIEHQRLPTVLRLYGADAAATPLVDEGMTIGLQLEGTSFQSKVAWDLFDVAAPVGAVRARLANAAYQGEATLRVVDTADEIVRGPMVNDLGQGARAGQDYTQCFEARSAGAPVAGVQWTFTVDPPGEVIAVQSNCATVRLAAAGTLVVHAASTGLTLDHTVTFLP